MTCLSGKATYISWCIPLDKKSKLLVSDITLFGVLAALTFGVKVVMSGLPNIEPVSLMVMLFAVLFGKKALYPIYVYVILEILVFGLSIWNLYYLYIWLILWLAAYLLRKMEDPLGWAILSGTFGLLFGAFCGIADLVIGGWSYALGKWISGLMFDLTHCVGNFVIALLLFKPLRGLLEKLYNRMRQ